MRNVGKHGLSMEDYEERWASQGGLCILCSRPAVAIDHDHRCCPGIYSCGKCIRGILCHNHNRGLGFFGDDPAELAAGIEYLLKY